MLKLMGKKIFTSLGSQILFIYTNGVLTINFLLQRAEVDELVLVPLTTLMLRFEAPNKVIQKRYDKLLDYDNLSRKGKDDKVSLSFINAISYSTFRNLDHSRW